MTVDEAKECIDGKFDAYASEFCCSAEERADVVRERDEIFALLDELTRYRLAICVNAAFNETK